MKKFLAVYLAPAEGMEEWAKTDPAITKPAEEKMKAEWDVWMKEHSSMLSGVTAGIGKTKRVTKEGVTDTKNDMMLYSVIEAKSHEEAAAIFENHPHLEIPNASIEIMPISFLPGAEVEHR